MALTMSPTNPFALNATDAMQSTPTASTSGFTYPPIASPSLTSTLDFTFDSTPAPKTESQQSSPVSRPSSNGGGQISRLGSPAVITATPPQQFSQQANPSGTAPTIFPEADALLCPSVDGFLVASHTTDGNASWTPVSWPTFLQFVCTETNVAHLPAKHPMRLFAKIVRDNSLQARLSPQQQQQHQFQQQQQQSQAAFASGLPAHLQGPIQLTQAPGLPNYSWSPPTQPQLNRSISAQHAIPRSPRYNPIAGRPQSARAVMNGAFANQQLSSPLSPYPIPQTPVSARYGPAAQAAFKTPRKPVDLNPTDDAYIWSASDKRLFVYGSKESENALGKPENTIILFPAGTTRETKEKDGSRALPAWTSSWPNSNEFLKNQVCGRGCSHANGFGQKRPVLIREHLRRCPHLPSNHPLKILSTLELEAHSKSQWAERQLKRKRLDLTVSTAPNANANAQPAMATTVNMQWSPDIPLTALPQTAFPTLQNNTGPMMSPVVNANPSTQNLPNINTNLPSQTGSVSPPSLTSDTSSDILPQYSASSDATSVQSATMSPQQSLATESYNTLSNDDFNDILALFNDPSNFNGISYS